MTKKSRDYRHITQCEKIANKKT